MLIRQKAIDTMCIMSKYSCQVRHLIPVWCQIRGH